MELRVEGEAFKGRRFAVPASGLRLGRSSSNDIPVRDAELSRNHCLFEPSGEAGIRLTDLASANGTFVNEKRLGAESVELKAGDVIRVGSTSVTVVDENAGPAEFDLGLGDKVTGGRSKVEGGTKDDENPPATMNRKILNALWAVVAVAFGAGIWLMLKTPSRPAIQTEEISDEKPTLVEMRYERVAADSTSIFRYCLTLTPDGALRVAIDDMAGEGRHVSRHTTLKDAAKARLMEMLSDEGFAALDSAYSGPEEEPPKLNSWSLAYYTTSTRKAVKVINTPEPDAFRRVREKIETFATNELGIRALQYSRACLLEMAHAAGDTGRMKWEDRDVEYGNLHASICAYREAISDLETVNPKPPEFEEYRAALERATKELDRRYKDQRFAAEQATSTGDWERAKRELRTLCEMIPDREDERNHEAALKLVDVEKRLGKKGGRR